MNNEQTSNIPIDAGAESIDAWALVEIFGHTKLAGRVTTRKLGTEVMFQVDVPRGDHEISHSELFSPKSIFSIKPTTEAWCRRWAAYAQEYGHAVLPFIPDTNRQIEAPSRDDDTYEELF